MTARLIDGKALAQRLRRQFRERVASLAAQRRVPGLVVTAAAKHAE